MPTHYQGPSANVTALDLYIKLMRSTESVNRVLLKILDEHDLTIGQLGILELLLHCGPMIQSDIGQKMLRSDSNTCTVIENLEKQGFVEREREVEDRRRVRVALTALGRAKIEKIFPIFATKMGGLFSVLSTAEQSTLAVALKKLGMNAQALTLNCESKNKSKTR